MGCAESKPAVQSPSRGGQNSRDRATFASDKVVDTDGMFDNPEDLVVPPAGGGDSPAPDTGENGWSQEGLPTSFGLSASASLSSLNASSTNSYLRPLDLPEGYLEKHRGSFSPLERKGTGIPRPAKPPTPSIPIHWASRFLPRQVGCRYEVHYNGGFNGGCINKSIAPPNQRRYIMYSEVLAKEEPPQGRGLAWPHPRPSEEDQLLLLPLSEIFNELPPAVDADEDNPLHRRGGKQRGHRWSKECVIIKKKIFCIREQIRKDEITEESNATVADAINTAVTSGMMQLAAVLIMLDAVLSDLLLLRKEPTEFMKYMRLSVGSHYLEEAVEEVKAPHTLLDVLGRMFLEDAAYCFLIARTLLSQMSRAK